MIQNHRAQHTPARVSSLARESSSLATRAPPRRRRNPPHRHLNRTVRRVSRLGLASIDARSRDDMSRRRRSPSRSRGSSSSSYTSSSSRSEKRPETERRVDVAGMSDDALLARRRRLMDLIDTEREIAERESRRARPREEGRETSGRRGGGGESKKRRRESDEEEEEEGQIRDVGGGRDVERPPPAKAAKSGYVPPHICLLYTSPSPRDS